MDVHKPYCPTKAKSSNYTFGCKIFTYLNASPAVILQWLEPLGRKLCHQMVTNNPKVFRPLGITLSCWQVSGGQPLLTYTWLPAQLFPPALNPARGSLCCLPQSSHCPVSFNLPQSNICHQLPGWLSWETLHQIFMAFRLPFTHPSSHGTVSSTRIIFFPSVENRTALGLNVGNIT